MTVFHQGQYVMKSMHFKLGEKCNYEPFCFYLINFCISQEYLSVFPQFSFSSPFSLFIFIQQNHLLFIRRVLCAFVRYVVTLYISVYLGSFFGKRDMQNSCLLKYLFYFWLCWRTFSSCCERRLLSSCGVRASL